jgi:RIO-like serine/threonine protein kinase
MMEKFPQTPAMPSAEKESGEAERERREKEYVAFIEDKIARPENYIAGTVYKLSDEVCVKIIPDDQVRSDVAVYNPENNPKREATIMESLSDLSVEGVRSPVFLDYYAQRNEFNEIYHAIIMEKLDAVNLQYIVNGIEDIPHGLYAKELFTKLEHYLDALHEKGIYHGEFELCNIMVGSQGEPYVIDFGRAGYLSENNDYQKKLLVDNDRQVFARVREEFLRYCKKHLNIL